MLFNIDEQVCSLEQAKELFRIGLIQDSLFYHNTFHDNSPTTTNEFVHIIDEHHNINKFDYDKSQIKNHNFYSAWTVAEMTMLLKNYIPHWDEKLKIWFYNGVDGDKRVFEKIGHAYASKLIYVLKKDICELDSFNKLIKK